MKPRAEWEREWQRKLARIDAAAPRTPHPGEGMDGGEAIEQRMAGEAFLLLLLQLLPGPKHYGGMRRWHAGYHRMCAFAYRQRPDLFPGATGEQVARAIGISKRAWLKHMGHVDAFLAGNTRHDADL